MVCAMYDGIYKNHISDVTVCKCAAFVTMVSVYILTVSVVIYCGRHIS
jgi:hypothetical protein